MNNASTMILFEDASSLYIWRKGREKNKVEKNQAKTSVVAEYLIEVCHLWPLEAKDYLPGAQQPRDYCRWRPRGENWNT